MKGLPRALYRPGQVAAMDRHAIEVLGIPGIELMERAGSFAYDNLRAAWPECRSLLVLCGSGNNGGDGYVIADLARRDGLHVDLIQMGDPERLSGDAATAAQRYLGNGGARRAWDGDLNLDPGSVVVDALLGTGLERQVRAEWAALIGAVNTAGVPVLAVDIPSGLSGDTGAMLGVAIRAEITVTFVGMKRGLLTGSGPAVAGSIRYFDLDLPASVRDSQQPPAAWRTDYNALRHLLRARRARDAHKGKFGHVLVVGGEHGTGGAVLMAARGALRVGAGLVSAVTRPVHAPALLASTPEIMALGIDVPRDLEPMLQRATVVAVGPGLGRSQWSRELFRRVLDAGLPLVVDADALNLLAEVPCPLPGSILTPHPGEAARLLSLDAASVQQDRWSAAVALQERYQGVIVLKGAGTVIQAGEAVPRVCTDGNPGLATGGTGDILTGICAGLLAQGLAPTVAAELGVCIHAAAADRAVKDGERGMIATDLLPPLRGLVNPL